MRIHVDRAIGRIKLYSILKSTIPISLARLTNQIIYVCVFLTNFQPVLIPLPHASAISVVPRCSEGLNHTKHLSPSVCWSINVLQRGSDADEADVNAYFEQLSDSDVDSTGDTAS